MYRFISAIALAICLVDSRRSSSTFCLLSIACSSDTLAPLGMVSMEALHSAICAYRPCFMDVVSRTMPCVRKPRSSLHAASACSPPVPAGSVPPQAKV